MSAVLCFNADQKPLKNFPPTYHMTGIVRASIVKSLSLSGTACTNGKISGMLPMRIGIARTTPTRNFRHNLLYSLSLDSDSAFKASTSSAVSMILYPASSTADLKRSTLTLSGSISTVADSVARFTTALSTPSTLFNAFSTLRTQLAHVIPSTGRVSFILLFLPPSAGSGSLSIAIT